MITIPSADTQPLDPENVLYHPEDYCFDDDIFTEDSDRLRQIKWILEHKLTMSERNIFLIYTDHDSSASKTAKILNCTPATVRNYINRIRLKIMNELNDNKIFTDSSYMHTDN